MPDYLALKTELGKAAYLGLTDQQARDLVAQNYPSTVPKPFTFGDVMGCLSSASVANVRGTPTATDLIENINAQDRTGISHWLAALQAGTPVITASEAAAVQAVLSATAPDPSGTVSLPGWNWPLTTADVAHARSL